MMSPTRIPFAPLFLTSSASPVLKVGDMLPEVTATVW
jgi:hypothetical protein